MEVKVGYIDVENSTASLAQAVSKQPVLTTNEADKLSFQFIEAVWC